MLQSNDLSRSFTALNQDTTLIVVIEMSQSIWLVAGMVPGVERQPLKKLNPDEDQLLKLMNRWRYEALRAGHAIERIVVAYEAGRDGFWLARWLRERGVEAYVIHPSSIAVSREHRRRTTAAAQARGGGSCKERSPCHGPPHSASHRHRHRDDGHVGQRDRVPPSTRQQGGRPLRWPHRLTGRKRQAAT
jgi:transposase